MQIRKIINKINKKFSSQEFSKINYNSEKCKKGDIFFAIKGSKLNGNQFIGNAIKKGAKTIVSNLNFQGYKNGILYIKSKNPRKLLSEVCCKIFKKKPNNLIAVTGTNGKSSIANFFFQILKINNIKVASIGTLGVSTNKSFKTTNNTTLDPILLNQTLEQLQEKGINNVILEASSHGLKQHRLAGLIFTTGIFTNLSRDHLDYHKSYKDYFNSKMILFNNLMKNKSNIIYDNEILESKKISKIVNKKNLNRITIGGKKSNLNIINHHYFGKNQSIKFEFKGKIFSFQTSLIGKIQIKNLLMAIIAAYSINLPMHKIIKSVKKIKPAKGRLEEIGRIKNNSKVILDYAHTPDALLNCIKSIKDQFKLSKINIVFGCGGERDKPKRKTMGRIANNYCDTIYLTDDNPRKENPKKIRLEIKKTISNSKLFEVPNRDKAISLAISNLKAGDILLVAGKGHENYQEYETKRFFSDTKCILRNINLKNQRLSNNLKLNIINENLSKKNKIEKHNINLASINSKEISKNNIFFAIKGKNVDGNKFANEAIKKGAETAIVESYFGKYNRKKIKVKNSLDLLTRSSKLVRKSLNINTVAITGSSGKTSLKELIGQSLRKIANTSYSKKSYNNKYGVPLSLFNINNNSVFGIFEAGMDKKGEIDKLTKLISPNLAIITNVSYAHIKNFNNLNEIAFAKSEIINNVLSGGTVVLNRDDKFFNFFRTKALKRNLKVISFGNKKNADVHILKTYNKKYKKKLIVKINDIKKSFIIKNNNFNHYLNILATIATISNFADIKNLKEDIFYNYNLPEGRGNFFKLKINNKIIYIIDESYNSNPLSLEHSIKNFSSMNIKSNKKNVLLGDMLELGKFSKKLHNQASNVINKSNINKVYVYGKHIKLTFNKIKPQKKGKILISKNDIYSLIKNDLKSNDFLMVKGSNATGLYEELSKIKLGSLNAL